MKTKRTRRTDAEWLELIQECRTSGLSDRCWCQEHNIHTSNFYYQIRRLKNLACDIPESICCSSGNKQEVVELTFGETFLSDPSSREKHRDTGSDLTETAVRFQVRDFQVEITNAASQDVIFHTISALRTLC